MGKKQKIRQQQKSVEITLKKDEQVIEQEQKQVQNDKITKISKKDKRKKKKIAKINSAKQQKTNMTNQQQKTIQIENNQQNQQIQQQVEDNEQNLIEIESSQVEDNFGNDIEFNPKGKQGFQSLINETHSQSHNNVKSISFKSTIIQQNQTNFYLFHLKKDTFYKATVPVHENINLTHLNQTVKLSIIDENLLKQGSQQCSSLFWENGRIQNSQIEFLRSSVFKIVNNQNKTKQIPSVTPKQKKKNLQKTTQQIIKRNIQQFIKPSTQVQLNEIIDFQHDFEWKEDSLVICRQKLILSQTKAPFENIDKKILSSNGSLMILGKKNTGKSTLAQYLKNTNPKQVCILDCDIGRSLTVSGCVSLITQTENINLWVGQFTPFNCINNYVNAIETLYQLYREKYFSKKLIINTMGYLSGLGEMIIYEIYNLVNPSEIIVLGSGNQQQQGNDNLSTILHHIKAGSYLNKLLTASPLNTGHQRGIRRFNQKRLNLSIQNLANIHAQSKGIPIRFESLLQHKKSFKNIIELIQAIKKKQLQKLQNIDLYQQDKLGNVIPLNKFQKDHSEMRIVLIGKWVQIAQSIQVQKSQSNDKLFRVFGIGFGFEGAVYYSQKQIEDVISPSTNFKQEAKNIAVVLSEGIDFEKNFYLINQMALIQHQLNYGSIPYIMPIIKGMGSKGTRNNPSKNI